MNRSEEIERLKAQIHDLRALQKTELKSTLDELPTGTIVQVTFDGSVEWYVKAPHVAAGSACWRDLIVCEDCSGPASFYDLAAFEVLQVRVAEMREVWS